MNFQQDVIERSYEVPVVVDFWAPWCGPCRVLGPVIEQLAAEQKDRWELVKVNTEEEQDIALQYRIRSIPNVKLFVDGKPVAEFAGALPRGMIEKWLDQNIPSEEKQALQSILERENGFPDPHIRDLLETFVKSHPQDKRARIALARHLLFDEPERARQLVEDIQASDEEYDSAQDILTLLELVEYEPAERTPAGAAMLIAKDALREGDGETAIKALISAVESDKKEANELARRAAIALFRLWGNDNPLTKEYRWRFDMALY